MNIGPIWHYNQCSGSIGHGWTICILLLVVASCSLTTECIRMIRVQHQWSSSRDSTGLEALLGSNLTLHCPFVLEANDQLYSIKWHKKLNGTYFEFYSYISTVPEPTVHHKPLPGVRLHLSTNETGERIRLVNVDLHSEGTFRCEAITDDTFQVVRHEMSLRVFSEYDHCGKKGRVTRATDCLPSVSPQSTPTISGPRRTYGLGERVHLTCISGASRPAARLQWFINDDPVPPSYVHSNEGSRMVCGDRVTRSADNTEVNTDEPTTVSQSELQFDLRREHLTEQNYFVVRCMSSMDAHFYPEVRNSSVNIVAWGNTTPVIVGLQSEYKLGDWVSVNCTVPEVVQHTDPNSVPSSTIRIEWRINRKRVSRESLVNYFTSGHIGLHFKLQPRHLTEDGSLTIECRTLQMWPVHRIGPHYNASVNELIEGEEEDSDGVTEPKRQTTTPTETVSPTTTERSKEAKPMQGSFPSVEDRSGPSTSHTKQIGSTPTNAEKSIDLGTTNGNSFEVETTTVNNDSSDYSDSTNSSSLLVSIRQFTESHPKVITSLRLTLIPIVVFGVLFAFA